MTSSRTPWTSSPITDIYVQLINRPMEHNSFFHRNTIKDYTVEHQPSTMRERSKRSMSVTAVKLNPSKFQHREVFDNRIYDKINFMKLDLKELKDQQDKAYVANGELARVGGLVGELLEDEGMQQIVSNFHNHCALMLKHQVRKDFVNTINQIVASLLRRIHLKVDQLISANKSNEAKVAQYQSKIRGEMSQLQESRRSMRKASRQKDLQQKINKLDFALKKEMLKVDQLEQQLREQTTLNVSLAESIKSMQIEKNAQSAYKQSMEYKVKRLKEELEVAHIIKEQNLADKMKYIMNW